MYHLLPTACSFGLRARGSRTRRCGTAYRPQTPQYTSETGAGSNGNRLLQDRSRRKALVIGFTPLSSLRDRRRRSKCKGVGELARRNLRRSSKWERRHSQRWGEQSLLSQGPTHHSLIHLPPHRFHNVPPPLNALTNAVVYLLLPCLINPSLSLSLSLSCLL